MNSHIIHMNSHVIKKQSMGNRQPTLDRFLLEAHLHPPFLMGSYCYCHLHPNQEHCLHEKSLMRWPSNMINDRDICFCFLKASEMGLEDLGGGWGCEEG